MSVAARWVLAARLAWRDVRHRPGRTALVVALIAVPVMAMTIGSVGYRTSRDSPREAYERNFGQSDAVALTSAGSTPSLAQLLAELPEGSRAVVAHQVWGQVTASDGARRNLQMTDLPLSDPLTFGMVEVVDGRAPAVTGEVVLDPASARTFGVDIGDQLTLVTPAMSARVVGVVRDASHRSNPLMVVGGFDFGVLRPEVVNSRVLVDLPAGLDARAAGLSRAFWAPGLDAMGRFVGARTEQLAWGWIAGALALVVTGIVVAAAFASSARRQLVTLGQLAANGADQRLLRRTLAIQGAWSGTIGALGGIAAGLALVLPRRDVLERIAGRRVGSMVVAPVDLCVIAVTGIVAATVAAFVPSRTASRVPVLSALAGRVPLGAIPRAMVPAGFVLAGSGVSLVAVGAAVGRDGDDANLTAGIIVTGGVAVLAGVCCLAPAIVAVFGAVASRTSGAVRVAARGLARSRTRSSAVIAATAAVGALSVGIATVVRADSTVDHSWERRTLGRNVAVINAYVIPEPETEPAVTGGSSLDQPRPTFPPLPTGSIQTARAIVPDAQMIRLRVATYDAAPEPVVDHPPSPAPGQSLPPVLIVADSAVLDVLDVSARDRVALGEVGILTARTWSSDVIFSENPATRSAVARTQGGEITADVAIAQDWYRGLPHGDVLISAERAADLGFVVVEAGALLVAPRDLDADQRDQLEKAFNGYDSSFVPASQLAAVGTYVTLASDDSDVVPDTLVDALIAAAALLLVAAVVAVALSLSAAEARDERDVLVAVGASPQTQRRVAGTTAALVALVGGVLAVPAGFLPVAAAVAQSNDSDISFPWLVAVGCVVAIPLAVGTAAAIGSSITNRVRRPVAR